MSKMTHVLHVSPLQPSKSLIIMLETQNLAHMFGGTCDKKLLGHWKEGPRFGPKAPLNPFQELE